MRSEVIPYDPMYPDSDGERMAENTTQYEWIVMLKGGLDALLEDFVAGDLLWYPVKGYPETRTAPDVLVALGRPKGPRGSYKQWEEDGLPPAVVIEVLSPGNTLGELARKLAFYDEHGVREYLIVDPMSMRLEVWERRGERLVQVHPADGWTSPLLGITARVVDGQIVVLRPDGRPFERFQVVHDRAEAAEARACAERARAEAAEARAAALEAELAALRARASEGE